MEKTRTIKVNGLGTITGTIEELHDLWMLLNYASSYAWDRNEHYEEDAPDVAELWYKSSMIANRMCCEISDQAHEIIGCHGGQI